MLVAAFRLGTALAGKAVSYDEDKGFWVTGAGQVTPEYVLDLDQKGELDWASDDVHEWIRTVILKTPIEPGAVSPPAPAATPPPPPPPPPPSPEPPAAAKTPPATPDEADVDKTKAKPDVVILPSLAEEEAGAAGDVDASPRTDGPPRQETAPRTPEPSSEAKRVLAEQLADERIAREKTNAAAREPKKKTRGAQQDESSARDSASRKPISHPADEEPIEVGESGGFFSGGRLIAIAAAVAALVVIAIVLSQTVFKSSAPREWTQLTALRGSAMAVSEPFQIGDGETKLDYKVERLTELGITSYVICVCPEGTPAEKENDYSVTTGSINADAASMTDGGSVVFSRPPGSYYLKVFSDNMSWSASVSEKK
jgi:hypothetical protein